MIVCITPEGRIHAEVSLDIDLPASAVWGQMRDIRRFLTLDPLHVHVRVAVPPGATDARPLGAPIVLRHRLLGVGVDRVGRVLKWDEGRGYAISDLSRRGNNVGFPHICEYALRPVTVSSSRLTFSARGLWTATWVPGILIRCWLSWVLWATARRIELEMLRLALKRERAGLSF